MATKFQAKSFEPYYLSVAVILFVSFIVGYVLKKLFYKHKIRSGVQNIASYSHSNDIFTEEEKNIENKKDNYEKTKKKKPRVKGLTKAVGFIPDEHKFKPKEVEEKPLSLVKEISEEDKVIIEDKSKELEKTNSKNEFIDQSNAEKSLKSIKKNPSSESKVSKEKKKSNYLNEYEKDSLYALMGLVSDSIPRIKEDTIYSVEYLFESKTKEKLQLSDKINNSKLALECKNVSNLKSLQKVLDLYIETQKKTIVLRETLIALVETALRVEELNHAAFFLTEMDNYNYPIPRQILELFMELQITQITLNQEIKKQKSSKKKEINKFDKFSNKLINPLTDNFITTPDYFYYNSKRLSYKSINIENTLKSLALNITCKPYYPKDKKVEDKKELIVSNERKDTDSSSKKDNPPQQDEKKVSEKEVKNNKTNELDTQEINKKIEIRLKDINFAEIKEFYPKNFKILPKTK